VRQDAGGSTEANVPDVTRFAGYPSPETLLADPWLSRDDKISGLRTWRRLILRVGVAEDERETRARLVGEIDRALDSLAEV
jgi:hypothetical protein